MYGHKADRNADGHLYASTHCEAKGPACAWVRQRTDRTTGKEQSRNLNHLGVPMTSDDDTAGPEHRMAQPQRQAAGRHGPARAAMPEAPQSFIVGSGMAGLACAAYLVRANAGGAGNIHLLEQHDRSGGGMDARGSPGQGYSVRGGRMLDEAACACIFDLMSFVPSLSGPGKTLRDECAAFNAGLHPQARSRLVSGGRIVDVSSPGFGTRDRLELIELMLRSEDALGNRRISDVFQPSFLETPFWRMWCTAFAFQPWHSAVEFRRHVLRFLQQLPHIETLAGVQCMPCNPYDSLVQPLVQWLQSQGVDFRYNVRVTDIEFTTTATATQATRLSCVEGDAASEITLRSQDRVFITLGSATADSALGSMDAAPTVNEGTDGSWSLWRAISRHRTAFGSPQVFDSHIDQSRGESFTLTCRSPRFFRMVEAITGNMAGAGGLVTLQDSAWRMSLVLPRQPHVLGQPEDVYVCGGSALLPATLGDFIGKSMLECSGAEILHELFSHLGCGAAAAELCSTATCIPCATPYLTSHLLVRSPGDRPAVIPEGAKNFAFVGRYCEMADDTVSTMEYSVRSAQTAVFTLLGLDTAVSPLYKGLHDPKVILGCMKALLQ